jgi:hypothetical protein
MHLQAVLSQLLPREMFVDGYQLAMLSKQPGIYTLVSTSGHAGMQGLLKAVMQLLASLLYNVHTPRRW